MSLESGQNLSHYEILAPLGRGGMGEVYRALDTKLGREVAIKVLPPAFAEDEERLRRFEREARTLASLNHSNVAGIHGVDQVGEICFLALELVPGEDLEARLQRGPLPLDEALNVALQIAEGLEAAHEAGVVHRDLKPANIRLTPEGVVKLLDFGLAKPLNQDAVRSTSSSADPDSLLMTQEGVVLGTPTYMSPEQARGKPVDRRTDVWAFGCLVFECLTGRRAFGGEVMADVLGAIVGRDPDWLCLPRSTPSRVRALLRRCLDKNPKRRLRDIGEARIALEQGDTSEEEPAAERASNRLLLCIGLSVGLVLGAIAGRWLWKHSSQELPSAGSAPVHLEVDLPHGAELALGAAMVGFDSTLLALSPEGRWLVYVGRNGDGTQLYRCDLFSFAPPRPIAGTKGALHTFFSPDGTQLGVATADRLLKVSLEGGDGLALAEIENVFRGVWGQDDWIYFGQDPDNTLRRVQVSGGKVEAVATLDDGFADVLPDGSGALFARRRLSIDGNYSRIEFFEFSSQQSTLLIDNGFDPRFVADGRWIVFARSGALFKVPFDRSTLRCTASPSPALSGVAMDSLFRQAQVAIGADGSLAFLPGGDGSIGRLAWIDREGHGETLPFEPRLYGVLDLDAHDDRLAVHVGGVTDSILICDLRSGTERFLRVGHHDGWPRWSHSGDRLAVASGGENETRTVKVLDVHSGSVQAWSSGESRDFTGGWSEDEEWVAFTRNATGNPNLSVHAVNAQGEEVLCTQNGFHCSFSPDGRWIVHTSTASGFLEIHARSWPDGEEVHRVSHLKGIEPIWCPSGEIFMRDGNRWYAVPVELEPEFSADRPRVAFETAFVDTPGVSYDVSSDGQRLYYVQQAEPDIRDRIRVISRWASTFGDAGSGG